MTRGPFVPPRPGKVATIEDVARASGVSKGTVSHVLNGRVPVSPRLREKVEAAIAALDYHPAETARRLSARKRLSEPAHYRGGASPRLTTVGYLSVDHVACLDRLPEREERRVGEAILKLIGGPAANIASIAAGLGEPFGVRASVLTSIGDDQESDWALDELTRRGVGVISSRPRRGARLNRAIVLVEADGRRTIVNEPLGLGEVDLRRFLERAEPDGAPWCLHLEGYQVPSQLPAIAEARRRGFTTSMHGAGLASALLSAHHAAILHGFDIVVLHRESLSAFPDCPNDPGVALDYIASIAGETGPGLLVLTLGADGAALRERGGPTVRVAAPRVRVRDLTGAGDAFVGAFLAQILNGAEPAAAARLACAAASLCVTAYGAAEMRPSVLTLEALETGEPLPA